MGLDTHEPRHRLSAYLRRQYGNEHRTKRFAGDIGCTPKAAENILDGHWPNSRHWAAIARRFGRDVVDAVFGPEIDETLARLEAEVRELEQQLEQTRSRARQAAGVAARTEGAVAATDNRPAVGKRPAEGRTF